MNNPDLFKEVSPLSAKDCFIVIERLKAGFNFPIHIHPECELNYIENARGAQRIVGDSIEEIDNTELVFIANPNLEHAWVDHNNHSSSIHEITIQFDRNLFAEDFLNKDQMSSIGELLQKGKHGVVFSKDAIMRIRPILKTLTCEQDSFYSFIKLLTILHELSHDSEMRELSNELFTPNVSVEKHLDLRMERVIEYINCHFCDPIRLQDVASIVNMSESSFNRFIRKHTSKSFIDFLTDMRLGMATRSLIDSSSSVAQISFECGFSNLSNFNRVFKKKKGITPSEFRENYRKRKLII